MRGRWYAAGGVLAVLLVGACSNSPGGSDSAIVNSEVGGNGGAVAPDAPPAAGRATGSYDVAGQAAGALIRGSGHAPAGTNAIPLFDSGYKIRTARMTVAVHGAENVAAKATEAGDIAISAGGEVDADNRTSGPQASASLTLRVPPETLPDTLTALSKLGVEKSRTSSSTDVTQKVADVSSRVESAQQSITRLRLLFGHATKIGAIIQLESELNAREADLESLQAQQRSLARQTSMATVSLTLLTAPKPAPKPAAEKDDEDNNGFVGGLKRGWDGFTGAAAWVAEAVGTVLPFLVLLLVLGIGVRWAWPKLPRRTVTPTPAPMPSE